MNEILVSNSKMHHKSGDLSKKQNMNTLISKLEQDDKILAELDNKLRSVSRRTLLDDDELLEPTEKSSSLPSLNIAGEWRRSATPTNTASAIIHTGTTEHSDTYRKAHNHSSSSSLSSGKLASYSNELKRIEDSLAAVRRSEHQHTTSTITNGRHLTTSKDRATAKPLISSSKHCTKIESSYLPEKSTSVSLSDQKQSSNLTNNDLDKLMAKLEQDNKILAELDKKLKKVTTSGLIDASTCQLSSSLPSLNTTNIPKSSALAGGQIGGVTSGSSSNLIPTKPSILSYTGHGLRLPSSIGNTTTTQPFNNQMDDLKQAEEIVDSIELPNRGRCKVFIARYNYDPYKQSPNDNPEAEVTLLAGDFILVFGNIDEDGFYYGELLDGRRGLVPSNFVEKLTGEDLFEFQASVLYGHNKDSESDTASFPPEFYDAILSETLGHTNFQHLLAPDDFHRINDYIDLEDGTEIDEDISDMDRAESDAAKTTVPPPQRLILERQLHKSVLIGWLHPEFPRIMIDHYQIYVDGVLKASIPSGDRTKALVEGVDSSMPHRISVRAVDRNGRYSRDPGCTVVIGKSIPFAPCCVKASNITSDSALISWIPCNSNFYHVVAVNSVEVRTVRPSIYKHLITGLSANTLYRVSVRAKPGKLLCSDEKNPKKLEMLTTFVDFRTLPKSLPDPPVDIQIESGPQEGTLLVTWLPITLNQFGTSNNCPVTGYAVFSGHKKLAEIDSPTGDHALLEIGSLEHLHKKLITVRTKSGENLSQDSMPCQIPDDLLKLPPMTHNPNVLTTKRTQLLSDSESDTELTRLMHNVARRNKEFDVVPQQYQQQRHQPQNLNYDLRHKMMANRQTNMAVAGTRVGSRIANRNMPGSSHIHHNDSMVRMTIPAIEITKETPSESVHPVESYSEEEFDASMKHRVHHNPSHHKRAGNSPMPPQRTRVISDFERSNFGPFNQLGHRRPQSQREREHGVRWFVALFDYDPLSMSPNPDAAEEELPFQEGQLIKIYGDKDADGFYRGEANGRIGYVPCNMVSEVQYDVENDPRFRNNPNDPWGHLMIRKMIALYDYDPQELSPNFDSEMELAFRTGDIIYVYGDMDEDGFYMGEVNGVRGLVPSNFLSDAGPVESTNVRHAKGLLNQQQQQHHFQQQHTQQQQLMRQQQLNQNLALSRSQGQMQGPMSMQQQQQLQQQGLMQQGSLVGTQYNQQQARFNQPGQQSFDPTVQAGMYSTQLQPMQPGQQPGQQQQFSSYQTGSQLGIGHSQQPGQQMYQSQGGVFPQQQQQSTQQQQLQQQAQLQQVQSQQQLQQANQSMGRGMRQQNPMVTMPHQQQGQFSTMFQGPGTAIGNKQRPTSLDLNSNTPRFGQQMQAGTGFGQMQAPTLQLPNQQQQPGQQPGQQQQSSGMLGSLFASGKKILEEATTPLGARGPFAHPNQPHQPMMGHHQPQQPMMGHHQPQQPTAQTSMLQTGQMNQPQLGAYGQQQPYNPLAPGQPGQQPSGTILNTMKNIFKL